MRKYLMDTEFIRATKERVHFIEVALHDLENGVIYDYHLDARLNSWEHRYFTRALNGHYGPRTKAVFEAVDVLHSGKFNRRFVREFCSQSKIEYQYEKLSTIEYLIPVLKNSMLYAWDISNDKDLFEIISPDNYQLIDVQAMWKSKYGGNQLSLIDAYKHVMYNLQIEDDRNLIEYAHYACCDVMLLAEVIDFIENFDQQLDAIPIHIDVRDKKIQANLDSIVSWKQSINDISEQLEKCVDNQKLTELSRKLIRQKKKIAKATKRNQVLMKADVYTNPWW